MLPLEDFYKLRRHKEARSGFYRCKECCQRIAESKLPHHKQYQRDYRARLRRDVLDHYGRKCACCDEATEVFLTIDHIDGTGWEHRKTVSVAMFYKWLRKMGFPPGFQTLCRNCNWAKHVLGECPHHVSS